MIMTEDTGRGCSTGSSSRQPFALQNSAASGASRIFSCPAIRNLLDRNPHSRVLMFSAPAGFGKTCALAALAREGAL